MSQLELAVRRDPDDWRALAQRLCVRLDGGAGGDGSGGGLGLGAGRHRPGRRAGRPSDHRVPLGDRPRTFTSARLCRKPSFATQAGSATPASRTPTAPSRWTYNVTPRRRSAWTTRTTSTTHDLASGVRDDRPGLNSLPARPCGRTTCSSSGSSTASAGTSPTCSTTVQDLSARGVACGCSPANGAQIDTMIAAGRLVLGIFAVLAEFERELIRERTVAGFEAARARGREKPGSSRCRKPQVRLAQSAMAHRDTSVSELCRELGIRPVTLYRYVGLQGPVSKMSPLVDLVPLPSNRVHRG